MNIIQEIFNDPMLKKILASKKENGEIIGWLDDKRIFEIYGPNFTILKISTSSEATRM